MPITTKTVADKWTRTFLRPSFSRPNLGQMRVSMIPMKKIKIGSTESEAAEASAIDGAMARPPR